MNKAPTNQELELLKKELQLERPLPHRTNAEELHIAFSHVFRQQDQALNFAKNIMLNDGESLIAGRAQDSIGNLWWLGVRITDLERWRTQGGYHHIALRDPEAPENNML